MNITKIIINLIIIFLISSCGRSGTLYLEEENKKKIENPQDNSIDETSKDKTPKEDQPLINNQ